MSSYSNGQYGEKVWEEKIVHQNEVGVVGGTTSTLKILEADKKRLMNLFNKEVAPVIPQRAKIIDLGIGPLARFAIEFAKKGYDVTGIDISQTTLDYSKKYIEKEKVKVSLVKSDITKLDNLNKKFDLAFCQSTFYHIPPHLTGIALLKINKTLNPHGRLMVEFGIHNRNRSVKERVYIPVYWVGHYLKKLMGSGFNVNVSRFEYPEIKEMIDRTGFQIEKRWGDAIFLLKKNGN